MTSVGSPLPELPVQLLDDGARLPTRAHAGDAGLDLSSVERCELPPGGRAVVGTGIAVAIPEGWAGLVCPRSGLAARHGICVVNGPGVIDAGYRGEVRVVLLNTDPTETFVVEPGDRVAQLVVIPAYTGAVRQVDELGSAERASNGFGSSGGFGGAS